ncbi:MAG TPA: PaaI family thioesterase [Candidatus Angelobacter sp.]|nr:PaaI family thioesterase [Candidatus Angelobacter sp.]
MQRGRTGVPEIGDEMLECCSMKMNMTDLRHTMSKIVPYWQTLGLELKEAEAGKAVFEAYVRPELLQNGVLHGGVLASIADSACAVAAISHIFPDNYATTINLQVAYLKPVAAGRFRAVGRCVRAGKSVLFSQAEVFDEKEALVCSASSQLMVIPWQKP